MIAKTLRVGIVAVGMHNLDIQPDKIDARSRQAEGATAFLCAQVDSNTVKLIGCWQPKAMIRYLHVSAHSTMSQYASAMFHGGHYSFNPGLTVPVH